MGFTRRYDRGHDHRNPDTGVLGFPRGVLEHQRPLHQVRRGTTEFCGQAGPDAGMVGLRPVHCSLGAPVRPGRDTANSRLGFDRRGHLRTGPLSGHLVAPGAGRRVEPGRRAEARAQASGTRPLQVYAPPHLYWPPTDGRGNGHCFGLARCVCGASLVRGGVLYKTKPRRTPPSSRLSRGIPRLQGARQSADSVSVLIRGVGTTGKGAEFGGVADHTPGDILVHFHSSHPTVIHQEGVAGGPSKPRDYPIPPESDAVARFLRCQVRLATRPEKRRECQSARPAAGASETSLVRDSALPRLSVIRHFAPESAACDH